MSKQKSRSPQTKAYTGETIHLPERKPGKAGSPRGLPEVPPVVKHRERYDNPPPSQRARKGGREDSKPAARATSKRSASASPDDAPEPPRRPLGQRIRRFVRRTALVVLVLVLLVTGLLWTQARAVAEEVVVPEARGNPSLATPLIGGVTVLLIGVDERADHPEEGVRSDTLILARLNGPGRYVNLLSIPRDTEVELPGIGPTKITIAYSQGYMRAEELYGAGTTPQQGGMALAAQTVENFLASHGRQIRVDYTAQINFDGFVGVIDALGGVTIDVPTPIVDYAYPTPDFGTITVEFEPGPQHMDGERALIYARTRHADSDFGRSERQQQVIRAIAAELQNRGWAGRMAALPVVLNSLKGGEGAVKPVVTTMPFDRPDMLPGLALLASGLEPDSIGRVRISPEDVSVIEDPITGNLTWDSEGVRAQVDQWLRRPQPPAPAESLEQAPE